MNLPNYLHAYVCESMSYVVIPYTHHHRDIDVLTIIMLKASCTYHT